MTSASGGAVLSGESITYQVVSAVAEAEGVDATDLSTPLYDVVDPDALERVFSADGDANPGRVVFDYCGYRVTVGGDGAVSVEARPGR